MIYVVIAFAVLITAGSLFGIIAPAGLVRFSRHFVKGPGIWFAIGVRLLLAYALWVVAPVSQAPDALRVLAVLALLGALLIPVLGRARVEALIGWFADRPSGLIRGWCVLGLAFGAFIYWSVSG